MALCEHGYLCAACGAEVEELGESELYLRYLLGEVAYEQLTQEPERHIACSPAVAQFLVIPGRAPIPCPGLFDKSGLDPDFVAAEEQRVTQAYQRLQNLAQQLAASPDPLIVRDYPRMPA